jgi:hypothetical protein
MRSNEGEFAGRATVAVVLTVGAALVLIYTTQSHGPGYNETAWVCLVVPIVAGFMCFRGFFGRIVAMAALCLLGYAVFIVVGDRVMSTM